MQCNASARSAVDSLHTRIRLHTNSHSRLALGKIGRIADKVPKMHGLDA